LRGVRISAETEEASGQDHGPVDHPRRLSASQPRGGLSRRRRRQWTRARQVRPGGAHRTHPVSGQQGATVRWGPAPPIAPAARP